MSDAPSALCNQLIVDFPTRRRPTVRFASNVTVHPVQSTLTMICHKEELWYSKREKAAMKMQMRLDAITQRRALLSHSVEDLEGVTVHGSHGSHGSQVAGLEEVSDPTEAKNKLRIKIQHRLAVVKLQDVTSDDELCRISQISSRRTSERAHQVAKTLLSALDG